MHAKEHRGRFPSSLTTIVPPIEETIPHSQYYDYDSKRPYDWLYFPGATTADGAQRLILASPTASTQESKSATSRIVAFADAHAEFWRESQYQEYLKHLSEEPKQ